MAASAQTAGRRHAGAAQGGQRGANTRGAGKSDSLQGAQGRTRERSYIRGVGEQGQRTPVF